MTRRSKARSRATAYAPRCGGRCSRCAADLKSQYATYVPQRRVPSRRGAMAQLVARLHGMQKVRGSSPLSSTLSSTRLVIARTASSAVRRCVVAGPAGTCGRSVAGGRGVRKTGTIRPGPVILIRAMSAAVPERCQVPVDSRARFDHFVLGGNGPQTARADGHPRRPSASLSCQMNPGRQGCGRGLHGRGERLVPAEGPLLSGSARHRPRVAGTRGTSQHIGGAWQEPPATPSAKPSRSRWARATRATRVSRAAASR